MGTGLQMENMVRKVRDTGRGQPVENLKCQAEALRNCSG